jgi:hypothetical protein
MATLTATMTDGDVMVDEDEDASDSNQLSNLLVYCCMRSTGYREEVYNEADNLIEDAPSLPNTSQGTSLRQKRRRKGSQKFEKDQMAASKKEERRVITLTSQKASHKQKKNSNILSFPSFPHSLLLPSLLS